MSEQHKKDLLSTIAEQKNLLKEKEKQKYQDNDDDEYDWNDYDDEEDEINQQGKNLSKVQVNTELKPKTVTGLKDHFFPSSNNSGKDNQQGTKFKQKDYYSSGNAYSQYNRLNTNNYNQQYNNNANQDEDIINSNLAYAQKPKYYNRQYGYTSDTKKYSNSNLNNSKREHNYNRKEYSNDDQLISQNQSNNENTGIKPQSKKYDREYSDFNKGYQFQYQYQNQYKEQYRNNYPNRHYSNKYRNEYDEYENENENELVEDIKKPVFVNSKLEGENNFTDLKKDGDLFLKRFQKAQSGDDLAIKDQLTNDDNNNDIKQDKAKDTAPISLSIEQKNDNQTKEKLSKEEAKKDETVLQIDHKQEEHLKEPLNEKHKEEAIDSIKEQIGNNQQSETPTEEAIDSNERNEIHHSYTTKPEGYYYQRNYYGSHSNPYHPYNYQNRGGARYNSYYNNNYYNSHYYHYNNYNNNYYNNADYNNQNYYNDNYNQNEFDNQAQCDNPNEHSKPQKKEPENYMEKIVENDGKKTAKSLKELFK